jgi:PAS domain S-box-containing protein
VFKDRGRGTTIDQHVDPIVTSESATLSTSLFETLPIGVVFQDAEGRITRANPAALRVLGLKLQQLQGRTSLDPNWKATREDGSDLPGEDHPAMVALRSGAPVHDMVMSVYNPLTDEQRWIRIDATPLFSHGESAPREVYTTFQDITELHRAELALRESEARFRLTFDQAPIGAALTNVDFRFTDVNAAFCEMLGYSREELLGLSFAEVTHPDDAELDLHESRRLTAGKIDEYVREKRYVRKDGVVVWGRVVARPVYDASGRHIAQLAMIDDITERKHAVEALRESEERLRATLDTMRIGCQILDSDWRYVYINPAAERHNRRPSAELVGKRYADMWPGIEHTEAYRVIETCMREGSVQTVLTELRFPDGTVGWFELIVQPMDGDVLIQSIDVSARIAADQALRDSEMRYRIVADNTYDWEWWLDPQGDFVYCSPGCAEITGHGPEEFMRDSGRLLEIVHPEDRDKVRAHLCSGNSETPKAAAVEFRVLARDGTERILDHRCRPVFAHDGTWLGQRASNRDVTERRRAEEEVRRLNEELRRRVVSRTEQLDAATHELEALAYSIAHDVRAPLRTIDGFSAAVLEDEGEALSEDARGSLQRVRAAAQTLARLLDDLTGLSRVSQGEVARERVDLSALAEDVAAEVTLGHPSRRVELKVAPGLVAEADPVLARLILRELLDNAWKFTSRREVAHVEVGAREADDGVALYVCDDGAGFDLRYAEHLFGVFQRMHPPGEFEGDGVGLAMVQRLVRRHGGRCWAQAEAGKGATFFFTLPDEADADAVGARRSPPTTGG